jgi:uncharacterized iron-regulated protein
VKTLVLALLATLLASCAAPRPSDRLGQNNPLVGRIWSVADGAFITEDELVTRLVTKRYVLLGEKHDNPRHHQLQARVVQALIKAGRKPAIAFEMIDEGQGPALETFLAGKPSSAAGLGPAINWESTGWPDWALYAPIAEAALAAGLPIRTANLSRDGVHAVASEGWTALAPERVSRLALTTEPSEETRAAMSEEMRASHCGLLPDDSIAPMIRVQRVRDGLMAEALAKPGADGAVLIAGNGHVRRDRGAPWYLALLDPAPAAIVSFLEVVDGRTEPSAYGKVFDNRLPFDYLWFTARVDDIDPCVRFHEQLKALGKPVPPASGS